MRKELLRKRLVWAFEEAQHKRGCPKNLLDTLRSMNKFEANVLYIKIYRF